MNKFYSLLCLTIISLASVQAWANDPYAAQKAYFQEAQNRAANQTADNLVDEGVDRLDSLLNDGSLEGLSETNKRKVRKVLQERSLVNGVQGRYMPKKVWEDDDDNEAGVNLLKKSDSRVLSRDAQGKISAPKKTWNNQ